MPTPHATPSVGARDGRVDQFGTMVRVMLRLKGRKQNELAAFYGLSESGFSRKLSDGTWTLREILSLADFFEEPVERLFKDPEMLLAAIGYNSESAGGGPVLTVIDGSGRASRRFERQVWPALVPDLT